MMIRTTLLAISALLIGASTVAAQEASVDDSNTLPHECTWKVDGIERQAMIALPVTAKTQPTPLVFVFHGHGGKMGQAFESFSIHRRWPEAIVVSPQGLDTPGTLTDPEGKRPGWQSLPGQQGDRDLKFFDIMLASLKEDYQVDEARIYATGHSNGAVFTYLLWATRGNVLAAVAPSAGVIRWELRRMLSPKPALILAGRQDRLVKFEWQQASIEFVRKLNQCHQGPAVNGLLHSYTSEINVPLQSYIYPGGHKFAADGVPSIVAFFQQQKLSVESAGERSEIAK